VLIAADLELHCLLLVRILDKLGIASFAGTEELSSLGHVTKSRGQGDAGHAAPSGQFNAVKKGLELSATLSPDKRVQLVNDHVPERRQEVGQGVPPTNELGLQRLGGD
jgi:hypothetical protein